MTPRLLVVNADDFGLTPGVCEGILRAAERGIVTSTSVLVAATATADYAGALISSGAGVGIHLAAVGEEPPVLTSREIPSLVDERGRFPRTWRQLVRKLTACTVDLDELRNELTAQLLLGADLGLRAGHLDTHQHIHLWPSIAGIVCDLAERFSIPVVRVPRSNRMTPTSLGIRLLSERLRARCAARSLSHSEAFAGLDHAGAMYGDRLLGTLETLAREGAASTELLVHPGSGPDPARRRYSWGYHWELEQEGLCDPSVLARVEQLGFVLGTHDALTDAAG